MSFADDVKNSYWADEPSIILWAWIDQDWNTQKWTFVKIYWKNFARHGLIAWASGSWKTKSLQLIIEQLSSLGVPVLAMDIKWDLSGLGAKWVENEKILSRSSSIGFSWQADNFPLELFSISWEQWIPLKISISEFWPMLISKILWLNETQSSILDVIFSFCDQASLPLIDLKDLRAVLSYIWSDWKQNFEANFGQISSQSINIILRKIISLESQWAEKFFGAPSFDIKDFFSQKNWKWVVNILDSRDIIQKPDVYSSFMLWLLSEIYEQLPEVWETQIPRFVIFIDEAHLVFENSSKALLDKLETTIKLIRSKWVWIWFISQSPSDISQAVLSQLWTKIQHVLRAFSVKDAKDIKLMSQNFPSSPYYDIASSLTNLWTWQALVVSLDQKWAPWMVVKTLIAPPSSRMDVLTDDEIQNIVESSNLFEKYSSSIDPQSAYEILTQKMAQSAQETDSQQPVSKTYRQPQEKSILEEALNSWAWKTVLKEVTRWIFWMLKPKTTRTTRKSTSRKTSNPFWWFFGL